jgi:hypothetical protein
MHAAADKIWRAIDRYSVAKGLPIIATVLMSFSGCDTNKTVLEEVVEHVYAVKANTDLSIHNRDGTVLVYGSDVNELRVRFAKKAYTRERLNDIAFDVSTKPGSVSITAKFPHQPKWGLSDHSGTADCTIVVPATASISALVLNAGEVLLDNMRGRRVHARISDGRIFARNCFTNMDLTMDRGTLTLSYDWWEKEKFSADAQLGQGNAWIFLPSDAALRLLARATHGKIANDFNDLPLTANCSARRMNTDQVINGGGGGTIKVRIEKGDIKITEANP